MAEHLNFDPKANPSLTAREELDDLIETLHCSGTLRVLNGFFGKIADVSEVAMQELATPTGQHVLANSALLLMAFARVDPDELQASLQGIERGAGLARRALQEEPPNTLTLLRLLHDPATRRGLFAMLLLLRSLGQDVSRELERAS